ncbi:MAG: hypothetical protein AAGA48_27035 [Myxococcota bacterium]
MAEDVDAATMLDRLQSQYRTQFAGRARVSRDPDVMERMIEQLASVAPQVAGKPDLQARWDESNELFRKEHEAILTARAVPGALQAHRLRQWAEMNMARYRRSFAGRNRNTRDLGLLADIRKSLEAQRARIAALHEESAALGLEADLQRIDETLGLCRTEEGRIREARTAGEQAEQGTRYANLANTQFGLYQNGFAGKSRLSRDPGRLLRIVSELEGIAAGMARLQAAGFQSEPNDRNFKVVTERVHAYKAEVQTIVEAHQTSQTSERVGALANAANAIFGEYREAFAGQDRQTRDEDLLDGLIERLWPIALHMDQIDRDEDDEINERNLRLVTDNLVLYAREWEAIRTAKADA